MAIIIKPKSLKLIAVSVIALVVLIWVGIQKPDTNETPVSPIVEPQLSAPLPASEPTPATPGATPTPSPAATKPTPASAPTPSPIKPLANLTAPPAGAKWIFSKNNIIQWSKEVGFKGEIYLVNAADNSIAGWILQETGIRQTSYTWNTRDVYVGATNPSKTTIAKGDYVVVLKFNTNPATEARSQRFSIVYENEVQIPSYTLTIQNYTFSPTSLVVKRGDKIVFTNTDSVTHEITLQTFPKTVIAPGASVTFDTSPLGTGPHNFYSETYSTLKITVTVQ
ncbi:MAG: hypothetical protein A2945_02905 [Candidatus Liptonbacteria bacterium RIFCSPLOWO2_01_FULL_52_25]|uniref:EfeO-type cupredoxin-like domain-containing protein n=1 Tax=Candidatus Liptonbacteria bacterium RIFCSPLOWO2_01_FULL_52_25 TaxID=1798650 RepID=A0A1G2CFP7_9BACT|nr:MAG: hypothetical protein A2945_02905 [Candidatus Liptonbacteria bacterium RIFCSPLOWO2_01_FULL_52_25]